MMGTIAMVGASVHGDPDMLLFQRNYQAHDDRRLQNDQDVDAAGQGLHRSEQQDHDIRSPLDDPDVDGASQENSRPEQQGDHPARGSRKLQNGPGEVTVSQEHDGLEHQGDIEAHGDRRQQNEPDVDAAGVGNERAELEDHDVRSPLGDSDEDDASQENSRPEQQGDHPARGSRKLQNGPGEDTVNQEHDGLEHQGDIEAHGDRRQQNEPDVDAAGVGNERAELQDHDIRSPLCDPDVDGACQENSRPEQQGHLNWYTLLEDLPNDHVGRGQIEDLNNRNLALSDDQHKPYSAPSDDGEVAVSDDTVLLPDLGTVPKDILYFNNVSTFEY